MTVPSLAVTEPIGPDGAPLLLLGPSLGTSTILWEDVEPALREHWRVAAWDLPGHGASPAATAPFTVDDLADGVAEVAARLGASRIRYAGVSLGGCVGLALALRHPDLVAGLAILASGAKIGQAEAWHARAAQVRAQSTSSLIIGSAQRWFAPESMTTHPVLTGRLLHALQDADDESYARCCEALATYDVRGRLGEIAAPVLAVWGAHDQVTPEASAREVADGVRDGRAAGIADGSHLLPAEQPEQVIRLLADFFGAAER
ncbi:alpha/beta fold hydrolase [Microbacterium sp. SYP-A9085]|uniref:alpha/beta fold hydrolase n=1 Tax=Microbacterium sp. SYP-A9085 TaxID=2664454 RepID=UPI00129C0FF0|nr:alpha/beta fold hydrolase [Microbacterium sp. SYP-A9085]MRH28620.1 alpha/beta fold hydrolase [Microbacterium sp. SYP-A9085]